ncbi:phospholipase D-like domain-containing protein [Candidatus Chloroploca sp. Khr17]|uniref:phospholipase D-like domain-containing protein n=1 Tax=Candidatus Chloroploca sp. Khr17 TaxID=2496869 RepID=UPI0013EB37DA|nr:phospholipase D-like domain-containing protein [Candidatus Chloroploca sp. Khr17]
MSLSEATCYRGAIAYWTVGPQYVSDVFPELLGRENSFLCIDFALPTSVAMLAGLAKASGQSLTDPHLFLHLRSFKGQPEVTNAGRDMPQHLLHPKMFLIDRRDETAELWVGSHNWTKRAIGGLNFEATIVIHLLRQSPLYAEALAELEYMRSCCDAFDLEQAGYYLWLQGLVPEHLFFECEGKQVQALSDQRLLLFGGNAEDFTDSDGVHVNRPVYLVVGDSQSGKIHPYKATIRTVSLQQTDIAKLAHGQADITSARWLYRTDCSLPVLKQHDPEHVAELTQAAYCVDLQVGEPMKEYLHILSITKKDRWRPDPMSKLKTRLQDQNLFESYEKTPERNSFAEQAKDLNKDVKILQPAPFQAVAERYTPTLHELRQKIHPKLFFRRQTAESLE